MSKLLDKLMARDEHVCPWWLAWTFDNPLRKRFHDPQEILGPFIQERMVVADIGCGMGYFSVALARMVGPDGRVLSVDLQQRMLDLCRKRAYRAGVGERISTLLAAADDIRVSGPVDFILAFWMVHEVKDIPRFFAQVAAVLKPGGHVLYVEPKMHVTPKRFEEIMGFAKSAGLEVCALPKIGFSRSALLVRS